MTPTRPAPLTTPWTDKVSPEAPLPDYPRPQMVRKAWQNLNGYWDCAITPKSAPRPKTFPNKILVPFPIESSLSGCQHQLKPEERLWYRRTFTLPESWYTGRVLLHFGAVDWECQVNVNDQEVGRHQGGFTPFTLDITHALRKQDNTLIVSVWDPSDSQPIQRGKQVLKPGFIWYTTISGIWQTVWLEHVPDSYIQQLRLTPDIDQAVLRIESRVVQAEHGQTLVAEALENGKVIAQTRGNPNETMILPINTPRLWSPQDPYLYDLSIRLESQRAVIDQVQSYFGMRKYSLGQDKNGTPRFCLNNEPLFLYGPLDQGYWPDGLYTPPTDEAMQWEIEFIKNAGFNMLRKHIKIEPARYYYHCDKIGLIVWQDMISGGISPKPIWFLFAQMFEHLKDTHAYWRLGRGQPENRQQFRQEYQEMIDALFNVVSIAIWGPFNEGWGQFDAAAIFQWTKSYDPSRLVDHASGWFDQGTGDFKSKHIYFKPLPAPPVEQHRALVLSEFGGYSLNIPEHAWRPDKEFGYKKFPDNDALTEGYLSLLQKELIPWIRKGLSAAVYTQTTDVETEVNGFLTYDRKAVKMDLEKIHQAHQALYEASPGKT